MNMYQLQMKRLLAWCQSCEWSATDYHGLFSKIYNVRHYEAIRANTENPYMAMEAYNSLQLAGKELVEFMHARCFPEVIKSAVFYLVQNNN